MDDYHEFCDAHEAKVPILITKLFFHCQGSANNVNIYPIDHCHRA
jgi:hypothetical protein